jgi:hypothetical protein
MPDFRSTFGVVMKSAVALLHLSGSKSLRMHSKNSKKKYYDKVSIVLLFLSIT